MAIVLDEVSAFESVLNYALFAGAIFQLLCIFAVLWFPESNSEKTDDYQCSTSVGSSTAQYGGRITHDQALRKGKKDKKKHR